MTLYSIAERVDKSHGLDGVHGPSEGFWIPPASCTLVPASDAWVHAEDQTGVDCVTFTATGARSPIIEIPLPFSGRLNAALSRGVVVADITWLYAVLTASLTSIAITVRRVTWASQNAVAATPTLASLTVTNLPSALTLTASAANAFYTVQSSLAITNQSNADIESLRVRIAPVLANTGVLKFAGAQVHYSQA